MSHDEVTGVLAAKRSELEAELDSLAAAPVETAGISFGKRVGEGTNLAVDRITSVAAHERLTAMLADVKAAQARLESGGYGVCVSCGRPIAAERLAALPWATRCVACPA
jgi:DnaK suppressor protein